jgi:hypothetical protein
MSNDHNQTSHHQTSHHHPQPHRDPALIQSPTADWLELSDSSEFATTRATIADPTVHSTRSSGTGHPGEYYRGQYGHHRGSMPWWIIIASWGLFGLPAIGFVGYQIANLLLAPTVGANVPSEPVQGDPIGTPNADDSLPLLLLSLLLIAGLLTILGHQTVRRIRYDRRQQRFRYRLKQQDL